MHTRYLSVEQQDFCLENPTYSALLAELQALRAEIQESQIEYDVGLRTHRFNKRHRENRIHDLRVDEDRFKLADDALSVLAEALVVGPVFQMTDAVEMVEGKWMWQLPRPEPRLQRDMSSVQMNNALPRHNDSTAFASTQQEPRPVRAMTRRIGGGLSRVFSRRGRPAEETISPPVF